MKLPHSIFRWSSVLVLLGGLVGEIHAGTSPASGTRPLKKTSDPLTALGMKLRFNRASGLYEQRVRVRNDSGAAITGFQLRISWTGKVLKLLTGKRAPGGGIYFHDQALAAGKSVTILLRYQQKRRGTVRKPATYHTLIMSPPEQPHPPVEVVTGGSDEPTGSGDSPDGGVTQELGSGCLTLRFDGNLGELATLLGTPLDPAGALVWLSWLDSGNADRTRPELRFPDPTDVDTGNDDPTTTGTGNDDTGRRIRPVEVERFEVMAGELPEIYLQAPVAPPYQIQYSDDEVTWNPCGEVTAVEDTLSHWIDPGPPLTASPPAGAISRFYRVVRLLR